MEKFNNPKSHNGVENDKNKKFAFFGTPEIAVEVLEILKSQRLVPSLIITAPDKAKGRGMKISPPAVKVWAEQNKIPFFQPEKLDSDFIQKLRLINCQLFVIVAYGKIIPKELLDIPEKGTINLHYSLLPKLRGASPVESAILEDINPSGVTIMYVDEKMDHGSIISQEEIYFENWPVSKEEMFKEFNQTGGKLLAEAINLCFDGEVASKEQDEKEATYTKKIKKEDGLIDLDGDQRQNYRKFLAFQPWPGVYFIKNGRPVRQAHGRRVKITDVSFENEKMEIKKVIPEGKKETDFKSFIQKSVI